jgi:hypothetical protein
MKCCSKEYPEPDIIDGTAYFVCFECGEAREIENYRMSTVEEQIEIFEKETGFKLPVEYKGYIGTNDSWVVKLPPCHSETTEYYFGEGFWEIAEFAGVNPDEHGSVFNSEYLSETWGLPKNLVLLDGDGHTWLALDYRESNVEPKVMVIESDECETLLVSNTFKEFIQHLLPYDSVYNSNGDVIYND